MTDNTTNQEEVDKTTQLRLQDNSSIRLQKQILRKEIRIKLKLLSNDDIEYQSQQVWKQLHNMSIYQNAKSIGLFLSMPTGEIQTKFAVQYAIQNNKDIYIPQVGSNFELPDMELIQIRTTTTTDDATTTTTTTTSSSLSEDENNKNTIYEHWPRNKWNIPEPPTDVILKIAQPGDIDLLIIPGLAFDIYGNRLGQGKGYYDRFIAKMCNTSNNNNNNKSSSVLKPPILIAVALQCQLIGAETSSSVTTIPVHEHDYPVDYIILPDRIIQVAK